MIDKIILKSGRRPDDKNLEIDTKERVTIFVGPNNSGKSALLRSVYKEVIGHNGEFDKIDKVKSSLKSVALIKFHEELLDIHPNTSGKKADDEVKIDNRLEDLSSWVRNLSQNWIGHHGQVFRRAFCIWLNGERRLLMLPNEQGVSLTNPVTPLARLIIDDQRRRLFQDEVYSGIGFYPIIDSVSAIGNLKITLSRTRLSADDERSLRDVVVSAVRDALPIEDASDGYKAYVGLLGALHATDYHVILVDEPEAFLHPSLARKLGRQIAERANGKEILIATHSGEFVMGAIESGAPVTIVRLEYFGDTATACEISNDEIRKFMQDPLLRSANVLSGLFSKSVIVTEADADRAFYQEVNNRLLAVKDPRAIEGALFLNAQNKQTVPAIVKLLRRMGIPCIGIVDLDVLSEGGTNWTKQVDAIAFPQISRTAFESNRKVLHTALQEVSDDPEKKNYKRNGGVSLLKQEDQEAAKIFLNTLQEYGLFVVDRGEVEAWLASLEIDRAKHSWLRNIFDAMGSNPASEDYLQPEDDDVWHFIGECNRWLSNPRRKGMN